MGGKNTSDIGQLCHEGVLRAAGCFTDGSVLQYGLPMPNTLSPDDDGIAIEGVYQDDRVVIGITKSHLHKHHSGRDLE